MNIAKKIQTEVEQKQQVTCSVGVAPNKLVAKIASDFKKPRGITLIKPRQVSRFLAPMDVIKLPGIGPKTSARLHEIGIEKIRDLRRFKKSQLSGMFGKFGSDVYDMCRGKDDSPVEERMEVKSIGRQVTFESDTRDRGLIYEAIEQMSRETREQLVTMNLLYQTVTVTVRYRGFETHTKAKSLEAPTDSLEAIIDTAKELVKPFFDDPRTIRLVGVRVSKLVGH
jgi:DNA polymerase IV (DinB-like DNA polymerase)